MIKIENTYLKELKKLRLEDLLCIVNIPKSMYYYWVKK